MAAAVFALASCPMVFVFHTILNDFAIRNSMIFRLKNHKFSDLET
jgi:hypothetical protein